MRPMPAVWFHNVTLALIASRVCQTKEELQSYAEVVSRQAFICYNMGLLPDEAAAIIKLKIEEERDEAFLRGLEE